MMLGSVLAWPVAVLVGRRAKHYQFGVPVVPTLHSRFSHDFVNVEPAKASRSFFRWYAVGTSILMGFAFAWCTVDNRQKAQNSWYNRPDFKPKAAMVKYDDDDVTENSMARAVYIRHRHLDDTKRGNFYRYFFSQDADFTLKNNPYRNAHHDDVYNPAKPYYSTYANSYRDHH